MFADLIDDSIVFVGDAAEFVNACIGLLNIVGN